MEHNEAIAMHRQRRTGQTLAEFAITLPILLLLLFGIIEFGRIFQAWVTLQNSARAAARYATTGTYDDDRYQLDLNAYDPNDTTWWGDPNSIVPCIRNVVPAADGVSEADALALNLAQRGTAITYPNADFLAFSSMDPVQAFQDGPESIYATYYGGDDCDPADPDDQNRRRDLARILSIYHEARIGAAGLALGDQLPPEPAVGFPSGAMDAWDIDDPTTWVLNLGGAHYPDPSTVPWYQVWDRPLPGDADGDPLTAAEYYHLRHSDEKGWFDLTICSSRPTLQNDPLLSHASGDGRFEFPTILESARDLRAPVCLLEEEPSGGNAAKGWTTNLNDPWLDAGGPGDTVSLVVTFNHPLITPLGLASYLPLQARRVAVNEAFRSPRAVPPSYSLPDPPKLLPTDTPTHTYTPSLEYVDADGDEYAGLRVHAGGAGQFVQLQRRPYLADHHQ